MYRREFLKTVMMGVTGMVTLGACRKDVHTMTIKPKRMPVLFVGHGSPMNAIEDNEFSQAWLEIGKRLPRPKAILCVSAHWETDGTAVTAMTNPRTIHDFSGFPEELYQKQYPAPGAPEWAAATRKLIRKTDVILDDAWGLDHGTWSVLCRMFPKADIPVFQLSLDFSKDAVYHYELARELDPLRDQGVLVVGSGNLVHNLRLMEWTDKPFDWAVSFDQTVKKLIEQRDHTALIHYKKLGREAELSIPTNEHYLPLMYVLALQGNDESARFFSEKVTLGSISMRGVEIG